MLVSTEGMSPVRDHGGEGKGSGAPSSLSLSKNFFYMLRW